jgi:hypothetical protein
MGQKPRSSKIVDGKGRRKSKPYESLADIAEKRRLEEEEWAAKCGPVTIRKIGDPK